MEFSLKQKLFMAKRDKKTTITLSLKEAEVQLEKEGTLDQLLSWCLDHLSREDMEEFAKMTIKE